MNPTLATLHWTGPHSFSEAIETYKYETDYGLYLIVGRHPAFGMEMPLYLGKAAEQLLATRLSQHQSWMRHESKELKVYVGRIISLPAKDANPNEPPPVPSDQLWSDLIHRAERLLIFSCSFPYNSSNVKWMDFHSDDLTVMNLGERHMLPMMVSTQYWKTYYALNGDGKDANPKELYWKWQGK